MHSKEILLYKWNSTKCTIESDIHDDTEDDNKKGAYTNFSVDNLHAGEAELMTNRAEHILVNLYNPFPLFPLR